MAVRWLKKALGAAGVIAVAVVVAIGIGAACAYGGTWAVDRVFGSGGER